MLTPRPSIEHLIRDMDSIEKYVQADVLHDQILEAYNTHGIDYDIAATFRVPKSGLQGEITPIHAVDQRVFGHFIRYPDNIPYQYYAYNVLDSSNMRAYTGFFREDRQAAERKHPKIVGCMIDEVSAVKLWVPNQPDKLEVLEKTTEGFIGRISLILATRNI